MNCPSETRLQAFVEGDLTRTEIDELSQHLDECIECRTLVGVVQPVVLDDERAVERIGRYVPRRILGQGGMGIVYEAADPELHRVVALKVLRSDLGVRQTRLLAEAEAMAALAHPNVVRIYDVGRAGERTFIVMELVDGASLRQWLAREPRSIASIVDAFLQAADGLCAAHAAGLVHRDFKPENVFVAGDGRVLVGDFGLAAALDGDAAAGEGSLAYMAPEQRSGQKVDARSDQYAFGVALREALDAEHPAGESTPRWLETIVARATRERADERFASMAELAAALRSGRRRARTRRRAFVLAAVALPLAGVLGVWTVRRATPSFALCRSDASVVSLWNADVAKRLEAQFRGTESPLWQAAWKRTASTLADYSAALERSRRQTCAVPAFGAAAQTVLAQRVGCLSERAEILGAVTASMEHADAAMLEQVPTMLQLLPRVDACESDHDIAERAPPPPPAVAASVDATRKKIAAAAATIAAGRYADGLALADDAWKAANATGYLPIVAEAYLWVGTAHGRLGHTKESERALEQAVSSASAGRAQPIAVRAWIQLMHFVGFEGKHYEDGFRYADYAKAALEAMPSAFDLEAERLAWSRAMLLDERRYDDALAVSKQELALVEMRFGPTHQRAAIALDGLASVLAGKCRARDAIEPQTKACRILENELGPNHPQLALCLGNQAALHAYLGEHALALAMKQRVLAMFQALPGHPNHVAMAHRNMVRSLIELGRVDEARAELARAAAASDRDADRLGVLLLRGELERREGKLDEARADHALAVEKTRASEPSRRLDYVLALAETELAAGHAAEAASLAHEASAIARAVYGEGACRTAEPLRVEADALAASGRDAEASPLAEAAQRALADAQIDPAVLARTGAVLAKIRAAR